MNTETPMMPSLPTSAIAADAPLCITGKRETMQFSGKYTCDTLSAGLVDRVTYRQRHRRQVSP
jgi:hypothetical protein